MALFTPIDYFRDFPKLTEPLRWTWFSELHNPYELHFHAIKQIVVSKRTKYQFVDVLETFSWGKILVLNGEPQSAQFDEAFYHESLVHPAMLAHPNPETVLVIGGGEGATLREVLRHKTVKRVTMIDIDEELIEIAKKYLKEWSQGAFEDPRVELRFGDARQVLKELNESYDIVICDLSEPSSSTPAYSIFNDEFMDALTDVLKPDGILVSQASDMKDLLQEDEISFHNVIRGLMLKRFKWVHSFATFIPSFFTEWLFIAGSNYYNVKDQGDIDAKIAQRIKGELKFYDSEAHKKIFALPKPMRKQLKEL